MALQFNPPVTSQPNPRHLHFSCPVWHLGTISWLGVEIHRDPSEKHGCNPLEPPGAQCELIGQSTKNLSLIERHIFLRIDDKLFESNYGRSE